MITISVNLFYCAFIYLDWLQESEFLILVQFCSESESEWDEIFFLWNETEPDFFLMRWDRIRFFFSEMRQNQVLFSWNETELKIFSWDEMKQKTEAVLMRQNQVFVRQNISSWFFDQSRAALLSVRARRSLIVSGMLIYIIIILEISFRTAWLRFFIFLAEIWQQMN